MKTYPIGTRYQPIGKDYVCTVIDVLRTYNSRDKLVAVRHVAKHTFAGAVIIDRNVVTATIARGLISEPVTA